MPGRHLVGIALGLLIVALPVSARAHGAGGDARRATGGCELDSTSRGKVESITAPVFVVPGGGRALAVVGDRILVKLEPGPGRPGGVVEEITPPGGGPPLHEHIDDDELIYVLEGRFEVRVGDQVTIAEAGAFASLPRGVPHGFRNVAATPSRVLVFITPGEIIGFFKRADELAARHEASPEKLGAVAGEFGLRILPPPGVSRPSPSLRPHRP